MVLAVDIAQAVSGHVGIDFGRADAGVAEQLLNDALVRAMIEEMGREAVAQNGRGCTVSVVNLVTNTVTATIPINGHPVWIASTAGAPTGKVYVVCKDSQVMSVIETDTDSLDTTVPLQGYGVSVRMTAP